MRVAIIDYGSGNLRSVAKAFEKVAETQDDIIVTNSPADLRSASHIVLPGVGSFADCMAGISEIKGMRQALQTEVVDGGKPFLGICVGMQLLAETGFENGEHLGLGWLNLECRKLDAEAENLRVPHMGWNELLNVAPHPLLNGIQNGAHAYFVHSYALYGKNFADNLLAETEYGGRINAMVGKNNIAGTQFHPEKSQETGLRILSNFIKWRP